jgi:hypothetical protein
LLGITLASVKVSLSVKAKLGVGRLTVEYGNATVDVVLVEFCMRFRTLSCACWTGVGEGVGVGLGVVVAVGEGVGVAERSQV